MHSIRQVFVCLTTIFSCAMFIGENVAFAQARSGSISGQVLSSDGRPIANTPVEIENTATGQRSNTTSDDEGNYRFERLPLRSYRVRIGQASWTDSQQVDVTNERDVQVRMRSADTPAAGATANNSTLVS